MVFHSLFSTPCFPHYCSFHAVSLPQFLFITVLGSQTVCVLKLVCLTILVFHCSYVSQSLFFTDGMCHSPCLFAILALFPSYTVLVYLSLHCLSGSSVSCFVLLYIKHTLLRERLFVEDKDYLLE